LAEQQHLVGKPVVQRLLTKPVAREDQISIVSIPKCERKHPIEALESAWNAPFLDCFEQDLGVGSGTEMCADGLKLTSKLGKIVDLAVESDDEPAARRGHGLVPERREVNNGQSPMAKTDPRVFVQPDAGIVGAAVRERVPHSLQPFRDHCAR
jgi:hypothetical protein